jgi:hypothetical protein
MTCFETSYNADSATLMCAQCGDHVAIPTKLKDNVEKLRKENTSVWILCDEHKGHVAHYYWRPEKRLACWDCFVQNSWPTKEAIQIKGEQLELYCHRLLEKLFEVKVRAQTSIDTITSYRDKTQEFGSTEFLEMVNEAHKLLYPLQETDFDRISIDFHSVPEAQEPKIEIDENPLALDAYAVETFGLKLPEQELIFKWLDLPN